MLKQVSQVFLAACHSNYFYINILFHFKVCVFLINSSVCVFHLVCLYQVLPWMLLLMIEYHSLLLTKINTYFKIVEKVESQFQDGQ